jgi:hypothetical protein
MSPMPYGNKSIFQKLEFPSNSSKTLKPIFFYLGKKKVMPWSSFSYTLNSIPLLSFITIALVFSEITMVQAPL